MQVFRPFSNGICSRMDIKGPKTLSLPLLSAAGNFEYAVETHET